LAQKRIHYTPYCAILFDHSAAVACKKSLRLAKNESFFGSDKRLELVQILILRRNSKNFIFNKANFAVECGRFGEKFNAVKNKSNWLAGSLSGPKSPIFRHTLQFFLTIALLWPAKNRFVWRKMGPFLAQTRPANQLQIKFGSCNPEIKV
jgi:hypothetical protein